MTFCKKENRDNYAREMKAMGLRVYCSSIRNQSVSTEYVSDYDGPVSHNMFGGTERKFFSVLYLAEVK